MSDALQIELHSKTTVRQYFDSKGLHLTFSQQRLLSNLNIYLKISFLYSLLDSAWPTTANVLAPNEACTKEKKTWTHALKSCFI